MKDALIITALLNHPGSRSIKTIAKLNQVSEKHVFDVFNRYIDACNHQLINAEDGDMRDDAIDKAEQIKDAWTRARSIK